MITSQGGFDNKRNLTASRSHRKSFKITMNWRKTEIIKNEENIYC